MKVDRVIDWLGRLMAGHLPPESRTERVLRTEKVIQVAKLLLRDEYELVRLHDVEGLSVESLTETTGLPDDTIRKNVKTVRAELRKMLEGSARAEQPPGPQEIVL
ncbi:MAG: hypothetical protein R3176_05430 [Woeseiaceae bacterium]|nr:hypothetical protein [Woeseiaceae bacterium]